MRGETSELLALDTPPTGTGSSLLGYDLTLPALSLRFLSLQEGLAELSYQRVHVCAADGDFSTLWTSESVPCQSALAGPSRGETVSQGPRASQQGKLPAFFPGMGLLQVIVARGIEEGPGLGRV